MMRFFMDETGATAIEYGLIAAMFAVTMIAAFAALGDEYVSMYAGVEDIMVNASNP